MALEHLEGHRVAYVPGEPHKPPGMHKDLTGRLVPVPLIHRLPELKLNHRNVGRLPP